MSSGGHITRARPPRRPVAAGRRAAARGVAAGLIVVLGSLGLTTAAEGQGSPSSAATPKLTILAQDLEVDAGGNFSVFVRVTGAKGGSRIAVDIADRISDEEELQASVTAEPEDVRARATFEPFALAETDTADQSAYFTIALSEPGQPRRPGNPGNWNYSLDEPGVYPIKIRLRGPAGGDLVTVVTYLVRRPGASDREPSVDPMRVSLLAPVSAPPPTDDARPEVLDADYLRDLDRFLATVADEPSVPLDFAVSPDTAGRMDGDPTALRTLEALTAEIGRDDRELTGAPYVDIDPSALVAAGLTDELIRQRDLGRRVLTSTFGSSGSDPGGDTWVLDRLVDPTTVGVLGQLGITHLVLPSAAVLDDPTGPVPVPVDGPPVDAVTMQRDGLTGTAASDPVLAAYQLLGRLSAAATIRPGGATAVRIDPSTVDRIELATVMAQLARSSTFLRPTTLSQVFQRGPVPDGRIALRTPPARDLGDYPRLVAETNQLLSSYASMFLGQPGVVEGFERPLARSASAELDLATRRAMVVGQRAKLEQRLGAVTTPERDRVTLGTRDARFPLPISSDLGAPAKVVVTLEAPDRLSIPTDTIDVTLTGERTVVPISVSTRATGDTPLRITVRTPDGNRVLSESQYTIRSTAVSGMGLALTIGAGGFLALWWGRHWYRSRQGDRLGRHVRRGDRPPPPSTDALFVGDAPDRAHSQPRTHQRSPSM